MIPSSLLALRVSSFLMIYAQTLVFLWQFFKSLLICFCGFAFLEFFFCIVNIFGECDILCDRVFHLILYESSWNAQGNALYSYLCLCSV